MKNSRSTARPSIVWIFLAQLMWCQSGQAATPEESTEEATRRMIARSLPAIREGGQSWITDNDCLSCHRVSFQVWALNRASEQGFKTDRQQLKEWNDWATDWRNMVKPHLRSETPMATALVGESDTMAQLLLGRPGKANQKTSDEVPPSSDPKWVATYRDHLVMAQRDDGAWEPVGQLPKQKRPLRETEEVTTMWTLLSLKDAGMAEPQMDRVFGKARGFLEAATTAQSIEWWAVRLMIEREFGVPEKAAAFHQELLALQHADGGWGWLKTDSSDALGTGIALYALAREGLSLDDGPVQAAIEFLAETQRSDGTWDVRGTKTADRDSVVDTASYWGTTWAAIGLLEFHRTDRKTATQPSTARQSARRATPVALTTSNEFQTRIRPLLLRYCGDCHTGPNESGLNFMNLETAVDFGEYHHRFVSVVRELERGAMPPPGADQPTGPEKQLLARWLRSQLKQRTPPGKPVIPDSSRQISQYVVSIYEDRKGHLWFGTMSRGAARYDGKSVTYLTGKDGLPGGGVTSFAEDIAGNLWIGTQEGICRYDGKSIRQFGESDGLEPLTDPTLPFPPGGGNVFIGEDQSLWANMRSGVFRWQHGRFVRFELPFDKRVIKSHGLVPGEAALTLEDREGNKWFTVDGYGVFRFDGTTFTHFTKSDGLCSNNVNDILQDKQGNLWFICMQSHQPQQTGDGGVCRFNGKTFETFPNVQGLHQNDIYTIGMDRTGNVWIGATGVGVYRYDGERFSLIDRTDRMDLTWSRGLQAFHQARNGTVWLGFSGGLFRVQGHSIINVDRDGPWDSVDVATE